MFSGIGAPEVAMPDWDWRWCAEIEPFASEVHRVRHGVANLGDVTADDFIERAMRVGSIDILVFGTPCQSFSIAGRRLGLDDPRGNLALLALGIARQLKPRWLVFENVPGLLSSDDGRDFGVFLRVMEKCGYFGAWRILDAQFAGVPQQRRRVFFVGYLGDWRPSAAVLFEPESLRGDPPPRREEGKGVAASLRSGPPNGGAGHGKLNGSDQMTLIPEVAWSLQERDHKGADSNTKVGHLIPVAFSCKDYGADAQHDKTPTLRSMTHSESHANAGGQLAVMDRYAVRRLTPRECERLQGFPDDFTAIPWRGKERSSCPDGPRYKALGNSMAVPVMNWILSRIETFDLTLGNLGDDHALK